MNRIEMPDVLKIREIIEEAKDIKTFIFHHNLDAKPGQFVNVWIPQVDEKPFSVSYQDYEKFGITVSKVGPFSAKLHDLKIGDKLGFRGPYGNHFNIEGRNVVLVGGGYGSAPLAFLADEAVKNNIYVHFIIGARSKDLLLFQERTKNNYVKTYFATDDGSYGFKGFTTDVLAKTLNEKKIDKVYACGPEMMLKKIVEICGQKNIPCEISLERYMKCGFGICGHCCLDDSGLRVCVDGPVFSGEVANQIFEFGRHRRDETGKKIRI